VGKLNNDSVLITTPDQACMAADIIILAVPGMRSAEDCMGFAMSLGGGVVGKVLILLLILYCTVLLLPRPLYGFPWFVSYIIRVSGCDRCH
jgi:hypothetical protein